MQNLNKIKKLIFNDAVSFERRLKIRDKLQYKFSDVIITLDSDNNLLFNEKLDEQPPKSSST